MNLKSFLFFFLFLNIQYIREPEKYIRRTYSCDTSDTKNIVVNGGRVMAPHARSIDVPKMSIVLRKSWLLCAVGRVVITVPITFFRKF